MTNIQTTYEPNNKTFTKKVKITKVCCGTMYHNKKYAKVEKKCIKV